MQSIDNTQKYTRLRCLPLRPVRPACCAPCLGFTMTLKSAWCWQCRFAWV